MINNTEFRTAVDLMERITFPMTTPANEEPIQFAEEYRMQHPLMTALKILHQTALEGTAAQKKELSTLRPKIKDLNLLLKSSALPSKLGELGMEMSEKEIESVRGIQIALPLTQCERFLELATLILRIALTALLDLVLLPGALILLIIACCKSNFNPTAEEIKKDKTPILLIHGSGFNQTEWVIGRQFLKKEEYGSVFSLNCDGLVGNDPKKGIEDYAREKISAEIRKIKEATGSDRVILIGHSMGGMIAGYYAEYCAEADQVTVEHVISIATPWQGTPMIDCFWKLGGCCSKKRETKRHQQMSLNGGTDEEPLFRQNLVAKALDSERKGFRKYYSIWSTTDYAVPDNHGRLTEDPRRQRSFSYLGHYALVVWPCVWTQTRSWLNEIYLSASASTRSSSTINSGMSCVTVTQIT